MHLCIDLLDITVRGRSCWRRSRLAPLEEVDVAMRSHHRDATRVRFRALLSKRRPLHRHGIHEVVRRALLILEVLPRPSVRQHRRPQRAADVVEVVVVAEGHPRHAHELRRLLDMERERIARKLRRPSLGGLVDSASGPVIVTLFDPSVPVIVTFSSCGGLHEAEARAPKPTIRLPMVLQPPRASLDLRRNPMTRSNERKTGAGARAAARQAVADPASPLSLVAERSAPTRTQSCFAATASGANRNQCPISMQSPGA